MSDYPQSTIELRRTPWERFLTAFGAFILLFPTVFILGAAVISFGSSIGLGLFMAALGLFMIFLCWVCCREVVARWTTRVRIEGDQVSLNLPASTGRPKVLTTLALSQIAAVDTREEVFKSLGMANLQRGFALELRDGSRLVLGADRPMGEHFYGDLALAIADRANVPIKEMGMYDGKAGLMQMAGSSAPEWTAKPLAPEQVAKRRKSVQLTWTILSVVLVLVVIARVLSRML
ncbi:hypothetical protein BH11PSE2_BH11PSE2_18970 [soil metagenome]